MRRSLPVAFMPHDNQHLAYNAQAPYMMPRACDHCAKGFIEAELIPFPKTFVPEGCTSARLPTVPETYRASEHEE